MDPGKVKAMTNWPIPQTKRELQQFLGFINFYQRFVKGFAGIVTVAVQTPALCIPDTLDRHVYFLLPVI